LRRCGNIAKGGGASVDNLRVAFIQRSFWGDFLMANSYMQRQNAYRQTQIHTASKEQLVLMLYDGVIRFSEQGREAITVKDLEKKQFALVRAQDIIFELVNGLDHERGGEIAANLSRLYAYAIKRLVEANLKNDPTGIDEAQDIFRNLREAWAGAMTKVAKEKAAGQTSPVEHSTSPEVTPKVREFSGIGIGSGAGFALSV
jgi:flagellar protein FliS